MSYTVRRATLWDATPLALTLRKEDRDELRAASGRDPREALRQGIRGGRAWVAIDDQGPYGIYGVVASQAPGVGHPWMCATDRLERHQRQFLRDCAGALKQLHEGFPVLTNFVDARNTVHVKWLAWCGFEFLRLLPRYGVEQRPFYQFQRINHV